MEPQKIQMTYDIIFGPRYTLVPLYLPEITPTGVIKEIHSAKANNAMKNHGKKR